jgi:riboflavin transporter FmnP
MKEVCLVCYPRVFGAGFIFLKEIFSMRKLNASGLAKLGMLTAVSIILVYLIHFPIFPSATFLEYDMADVPILVATFMFGPWWGLLLTLTVSVLQWLLVSPQSGWVGAAMHFFATGSYVLIAGSVYMRRRTIKGAILGMALGAIAQVAMMLPLNLIFTVHFYGMPKEAVEGMLLPAIIPFNAIKVGANSILTLLLYKRTAKLLDHLGTPDADK